MERAAWTDERLDDLATAMREGFARVDTDLRDLRGEIGDVRREIGGLRGEINDLRLIMFRGWIGMMVGFLGVIAAILARGV